MPTLREIIWDRYYAPLDNDTDSNKDVQGKGTMRRYNEAIATDADVLLDLIANVLLNTAQPHTIEERFFPFREEHLGNNIQPFLLSADVAMRRRVLRNWHRLVSERGTTTGLIKLFRWLGFTGATAVTEFFIDGWDSDTWDGDVLTNWDMGRCASCTPYDIALVGAFHIDESVWFGIVSAVLFHQPINADLRVITYEYLPDPPFQIYPIVSFTGSYQTSKNGAHTPVISGGGTTAWLFDSNMPFGSAGQQFGFSPSFIYTDGTTKTVNYYVQSVSSCDALDFENESIIGAFDASLFQQSKEWYFSDNQLLTSIIFPPVNNVNITFFEFRSLPLITIFDFSTFLYIGGDIDLSGNPQVTLLIFNAVKSTAKTSLFDGRGLGVPFIDLEPIWLFTDCVVRIDNCAALTSFTAATTISLLSIASVSASYCQLLNTFDISALRGEIGLIDFTGCIALTTFNVGTGFARTGASEVQGSGAISLSGSLDWTALPVKNTVNLSGAAITDILHVTDVSPLAVYDLSNCVNLVYFSLAPLQGILTGDGSTIRLNDCTLTAGDVDSFLADILAVLVGRGEIAPGSYTGRTVYIGGSNAAPTGAGIATVAALALLGVVVSHT